MAGRPQIRSVEPGPSMRALVREFDLLRAAYARLERAKPGEGEGAAAQAAQALQAVNFQISKNSEKRGLVDPDARTRYTRAQSAPLNLGDSAPDFQSDFQPLSASRKGM